jgi:cytochrome P450
MAEDGSEILDFPPLLLRPENCPFSISPVYRQLRAERPVARVRLQNGDTAWLISSHQDQRAILSDPRVSSDSTKPGFPAFYESNGRREGLRTLISMDNPEHHEYRRKLARYFSIKQIEALRPRIQRIVDDAIGEMSETTPPVDLTRAFSAPVSARTMCAFFGLPEADGEFIQEISPIFDRPTEGRKLNDASRRLFGYFFRLMEEKKKHPDESMVSDLVTRYVVPEKLSVEDAAAQAAHIMNAGYGTVWNTIPLGILMLLEHPAELARLRDSDDPDLPARAVNELLRLLNPNQIGRRRVALEDIEIGGQLIRAGEGVIMPTQSGNRDESVFPDPERLDIGRDARQHIAFSYGFHQCIGQYVARVELEVAITTLVRRIPTLELAKPMSELTFKGDLIVYGVDVLPVSWTGTPAPRKE